MLSFSPTPEYRRNTFELIVPQSHRWRIAKAEWRKSGHPEAIPEVNDLILNGSPALAEGYHSNFLRVSLPHHAGLDLTKVRKWLREEDPRLIYTIRLRYTVQEQEYQYLKWFDGLCFDFRPQDDDLAMMFRLTFSVAVPPRIYDYRARQPQPSI